MAVLDAAAAAAAAPEAEDEDEEAAAVATADEGDEEAGADDDDAGVDDDDDDAAAVTFVYEYTLSRLGPPHMNALLPAQAMEQLLSAAATLPALKLFAQ